MPDTSSKLEADRRLIVEAKGRGRLATLGAYLKLSGPGWLQSALTLGGGSLSSSLYLGVVAGVTLLWLQPFAMVLGIIMLSAIGYVSMSTRERPFEAINRHVNPVLGWGWALASLLANMVWALPQYSLATSVLQQNLGVLPDEGGGYGGKLVIALAILVVTTAITWSYGNGGWGVKLYETLLKLMVGVIVACFIGVVVKLSLAEGDPLPWGDIFAGFIPDFGSVFTPAEEFTPFLERLSSSSREYWSRHIVAEQRDVVISAAATAVGINMTFLFPYSILRRGWGKEFRGLGKFDLATGMFIPYVLATSCVVIASFSQFHTEPAPGLLASEDDPAHAEAPPALRKGYEGMLERRVLAELGGPEEGRRGLGAVVLRAAGDDDDQARARIRESVLADPKRSAALEKLEGDERDRRLGRLVDDEIDARVDAEINRRGRALPEGERLIAATLVRRDARDLAGSLRPLTGDLFGNLIFGVGVLAMALSTITLLMLISGFVICEIFNLPQGGWYHRLGCLAAATGVLGPFVWGSEAMFWVAVPTSVFGFTLLPIAYLTFFLLMNQRSLLGEEMPSGGRRVAWNTAMGIAAGVATLGSIYMVWVKAGVWGLLAAGLFGLAAIAVHFARRRESGRTPPPPPHPPGPESSLPR